MAAMQQHQHNTTSPSADNWEGYQWNVPLDEIIDCTKCPEGCQECYYKGKHAPNYFKAIFVFIIFAISIIMTAMIVRFAAFGSKTYTMGAGDELLLGGGDEFSRLFCEALTVKTSRQAELEKTISEYVFTSEPRFLDHIENYDIVESVMVAPNLYPNWAYHLNSKGPQTDKITIESCSPNQSLKFNFFCTKSDFQDFVSSGGSCSACICHECMFYPCNTEKTSCHFSASKTDTYYMTLVGSKATENVAIAFHFRRSRYDLSSAARSCTQQSQCSVKLPMKTTDIILKLPQNATINPSQISTECIPRLSLYFAFFLVLPVGIGLVFGALAFLLMKLQQSVMKDVEQADLQREYRQMGSEIHTITAARSNAASLRTDQRPLSPPPAYDTPSRRPISINSNSRREPLVENEQPVANSLPDYESVLTHIRSASPGPPSYDSLNS